MFSILSRVVNRDRGASNSREGNSAQNELFYTTERVDSIYHVLAFVVTHPAYMEEALKALKLSKLPLINVLVCCQGRRSGSKRHSSSASDMSETINKSSGGLLCILVLMLLLQIIGLFAFISVFSFPECEVPADCPETTFCYDGALVKTNAGYTSGCLSCGFVDEDRRNRWTKFLYPVTVVLEEGGVLPPTCDTEVFSNNHGNHFQGCIAMMLVAFVVSMTLAQEEGEIMLTDIFLRRSGYSWWRFTYYDDDDSYINRKSVGMVNQARFELFQFLRRFSMQVQIAICTTLVLVTCTAAKDYFLDATAVLFVVDIDNVLFKTLMTSRDREFCLEATKLTLDAIETWTLQVAKIAHGMAMFLLIFFLSIWLKYNGVQGMVTSVGELPALLAFVFGFAQWVVSTAVLFASSWARNRDRWTTKKVLNKMWRAALYMYLGAFSGCVVVLHHFWGVTAFIVGHSIVMLYIRFKKDVRSGAMRMEVKERMNDIKARLEARHKSITGETMLKFLQRANDGGGGN